MKEMTSGRFINRLQKKMYKPVFGKIQLTYRCNLDCIYCYCKGVEDKKRELNTLQWKRVLDEARRQGCVYLTFTGGEPLIREDFLELYSYAKEKGFFITIFTNGQALKGKLLGYLTKSPPRSIEITLNGITAQTYESITQIRGSFSRVMENIKKIKEKKLPLQLKSYCLKQNINEIPKIKAFADEFLGMSNGRYLYRYHPMIYPRLNGDRTPANFRISFEERLELIKQDADLWKEYQKIFSNGLPELERDKNFLYRCNEWMKHFLIDPYGRLKFCVFSEKFSIDLKTTKFRKGFYKIFPKLLNEKFKTNSKCKDCRLRSICYYCPPRAYLETGNEETPVTYYCELAKQTARLMGIQLQGC